MGIQSRPSDLYISTENILNRVTVLELFLYYIPSAKSIDLSFCSELRDDKSPSCRIFIHEGTYLYKDFSEGTTLNCFQYVMERFGLTFQNALLKINSDFNLGLDNSNAPESKEVFRKKLTKSVEIKRRRKVIEIVPRTWRNFDIHLWAQWGIQLNTLDYFNVVPISSFYTDGIRTNTTEQSPAYVYRLFGRFKIYRPLEKGPRKWRSNTYKNDLQGWEQLPEKGKLVIITSSLKDVMFLYELGYNAIALHGEADIPNPDMIKHLESRFERIVFLYDNDWDKEKNWGQISALKFSEEFGKENIVIPDKYKSSDPTDLVKNVGLDNATIIINTIL